MDERNSTLPEDTCRRCGSTLAVVVLFALAAAALLFVSCMLLRMGLGHLTQFRVRNATGLPVAATSAHTHGTVRIPDGEAVLLPHTSGDIIVTLPDGRTWVYRDVDLGLFDGTPFMVKKAYRFFGLEGGYLVCGSSTVNLLLSGDGCLYAVLPGAEGKGVVEVEGTEQPKGFPARPAAVPGKGK